MFYDRIVIFQVGGLLEKMQRQWSHDLHFTLLIERGCVSHCDMVHAQVYAIVIERDSNTTSVYYWLFYPFNYGKDVGLCFNNLPEALLGTAVSKISGFLNKVFGGSSSPTVGVTGADAKLLSTSSSQV